MANDVVAWAVAIIFFIILVSIQYVLNKILLNLKEVIRLLGLLLNKNTDI